MAEREDITPWQALMQAVVIASARTAEVEEHRRRAVEEHGGDLLHPDVLRLARESRLERTQETRAATAAITCGIGERLVRETELNAHIIIQVIGRTLDDMQLPMEQRVQAHGLVHKHLLAIESSDADDQRLSQPLGPGETAPFGTPEGTGWQHGPAGVVDQPRAVDPGPRPNEAGWPVAGARPDADGSPTTDRREAQEDATGVDRGRYADD